MRGPLEYRHRLNGVHPALIAVLYRAAVLLFAASGRRSVVRITEGLRTRERQEKLLAQGKTWTLNSYHLTGLAVDVAIRRDGEITWDLEYYKDFAEHVETASGEMGVIVTWGGWWQQVDGCHFQLETRD